MNDDLEARAGTRQLIVNADDFGLSHGVNHGIIHTYEGGVVTSSSLMVRYPAAREAAAYARQHASLSVGLHLDLGEWIFQAGAWIQRYAVVPGDDAASIASEVNRQLEAFVDLMGRPPTHIDSHQHVHQDVPARGIVLEAARALCVPVRHFSRCITYRGDFYGQTAKGDPYHDALAVESLVHLIHHLAPGVTELGCHPGFADDIDSVYAQEREIELRSLCDPRVIAAVRQAGVRLCSFSDVAGD